MARKPSPWYREERNEWCVTVHGEHHRLGEHPKGAPAPKKLKTGWNAPPSIMDAFHKLMGGERPQPAGGDAVVTVLDDYITWARENRAEKTWTRYEDFIQDFVKA